MNRYDIIGASHAPLLCRVLRKCGVTTDLKAWELKEISGMFRANPFAKAVMMAERKVADHLDSLLSSRDAIGFHAVGIVGGREVPNPSTREELLQSYLDARGKVLEYRIGIAVAHLNVRRDVSGQSSRCCSQQLTLSALDEEGVRNLVASVPDAEIGHAGLGYRPFTNPYASRMVDDLETEISIFENLLEATIRAMLPELNR